MLPFFYSIISSVVFSDSILANNGSKAILELPIKSFPAHVVPTKMHPSVLALVFPV